MLDPALPPPPAVNIPPNDESLPLLAALPFGAPDPPPPIVIVYVVPGVTAR
jgi:hypothetical protein